MEDFIIIHSWIFIVEQLGNVKPSKDHLGYDSCLGNARIVANALWNRSRDSMYSVCRVRYDVIGVLKPDIVVDLG